VHTQAHNYRVTLCVPCFVIMRGQVQLFGPLGSIRATLDVTELCSHIVPAATDENSRVSLATGLWAGRPSHISSRGGDLCRLPYSGA
jgi:hypothetical protein